MGKNVITVGALALTLGFSTLAQAQDSHRAQGLDVTLAADQGPNGACNGQCSGKCKTDDDNGS